MLTLNVDILLILFVAIKKRVEALDKEEKELDLRLKQLQMKGIKIKIIICLLKKSYIPDDIRQKIFKIVMMIAVANTIQMEPI